jgi:hypothetical protein
MRKLLFIAPAFMLLFACTETQTVEVGNKTTMVVDPVFVRNTGSYPLVIAEVKGSCSCTVAERPEDPIQPGEEGVIKADVDTERTSTGEITKSVRIVANTEPSVTEVAIKAMVKPK